MKKERALLRVLRAAHEPKISQTKLARRARLSAARYWQIENGEGAPASDTERAAVAAVLGVDVTEIAWPEFTNENARASA